MSGSWAFLGFRKSLASDRSMVKVTVNLCVIDKRSTREEASYLPPKTDAEHPRRSGMVGANRGGPPAET
jgi:hypothetical protein